MKMTEVHLNILRLDTTYLRGRLAAAVGWYVRMSIVAICIVLALGVLFSLCTGSSVIQGAGLGMLCSFPLVFIFWLQFLVVAFLVQISPKIALRNLLFWQLDLLVSSVYTRHLKVPLSPPRSCLA